MDLELLKTIFLELVEKYGLLGIFIIGFVEPIFLPFPAEIFMIVGISMGLDWVHVLLAGSGGSILGSIVTYYLSTTYGEKLALKLFKEEDFRKGERFFKKHGIMGFIIVSFTPLPFEVMCWVCGAFEMPFEKYITAVFLSRLIKHGIFIMPFALWGSTDIWELLNHIPDI
ncbi:DedA family protein [Methanothermococcus sp. SCGC AD-155-C09]|nr:DedA family protein [Methanothermococcus sp. SCGC AD-155-C09]